MQHAENNPPKTPEQAPQKLPASASPASPIARVLAMSNMSTDSMEAHFEQGYDSDGEKGPFNRMYTEQELLLDEEETIGEEADQDQNKKVPSTTSTAAAAPMEIAKMEFVFLSKKDIDKMNVSELKDQLAFRRQPFYGRKAELQKRLKKAISDGVKCDTIGLANRSCNMQPKELSGFPSTARWVPLEPLTDAVAEPENPNFRLPRAPTVPVEDASIVPQKHDFQEKYTRPSFKGTLKSPMKARNGRFKKDGDGNIMYTETVRKKGGPNPTFIKQNGLTKTSHPAHWLQAFIPESAIKLWTRHTNMKALLSGAGTESGIYSDFKPFSENEIRQHIGLYMFNGISPSPRVEMKFRPQAIDPTNGNDFIYNSFGVNAERRHRHFKCFFGVQDPRKEPPPRKDRPNFKVDPLLKTLARNSMAAWILGRDVSVDEQTIGFQGNHSDKLRITYKKEGDGFQCDALCQDGYTYCFYFRNEPPPRQYKKEGFSPLHSRVLALFDNLHDEYHRCGMDNLYMSARFARAAFNHPKKVMVSGVTRKGMRGLPKCVIQEEQKSQKDQRKTRGTVKAAVLVGDDKCPNLIAASVYDTKPVHFLSMSCEEIKWIEKVRQVFNVDSGVVEFMKFLRLNVNDDYNFLMGHVDISDQLRHYYRFDIWLRNRKWWWSIFFWSMGVSLVNAYVLYKTYMEEEGVDSKNTLSQYQFREMVALAWIDPDNYWPAEGRSFETPSTILSKKRTSPNESSGSGNKKKRRISPRNSDSASPGSAGSRGRAPPFTDDTLDPVTGKLRIRLSRSHTHWPEATRGRMRCGLHKWCAGFEVKGKNILMCSTCGVGLCADCYRVFHEEPDLVGKKESLAATLKTNSKVKDPNPNMESG